MKRASEPRVDRLLSFLPLFDQRGYSYGEWHRPAGQVPYFMVSEDVSRFVQVLHDDGWVAWVPRPAG